MNQHKTALYLLKGIIGEASAEEQARVADAADRIRAIAAESDEAKVAVSLVLAEQMAAS